MPTSPPAQHKAMRSDSSGKKVPIRDHEDFLALLLEMEEDERKKSFRWVLHFTHISSAVRFMGKVNINRKLSLYWYLYGNSNWLKHGVLFLGNFFHNVRVGHGSLQAIHIVYICY
jgi:hypothetical protein